MLNRSTIWAVVFLMATFAAGIAVGAGGRRSGSATRPRRRSIASAASIE